jgi:hypothetical protein
MVYSVQDITFYRFICCLRIRYCHQNAVFYDVLSTFMVFKNHKGTAY